MYKEFVKFVQELYNTKELISLHSPQFKGNEKKYLLETIDSTFVSSVGKFVDQFEQKISEYTGVKYAIATVNGVAALHIALKLAGVKNNSEVITQSLTFVATCNAVRYCGARPIFIDVDKNTLGLSPAKLEDFLHRNAEIRDDGFCWNKTSEKIISACLPMHTFGFPVELNKLKKICDQYNIPIVEDAAESLGSFYNKQHTGSIGELSAISFNGNKIITTGGGGVILTNNKTLAKQAKHITTTAKIPHQYKFDHDEIGYNYRLPNLNAALGVAQMEQLPEYLKNKREIATMYQQWGERHDLQFITESVNTKANYWLNAVIMKNKQQRNKMLEITNKNDVMTRPVWIPMHKLKINQDCQKDNMFNTEWLSSRVVNVPSSINLK